MRKLVLNIALLLSLVLVSSGCGFFGGEEETEASPDDPMVIYENLMVLTFNESNELLNDFNLSLDQLYAQEITEQDFTRRAKEYIPRANEISTRLDEVMYDVDESMYDVHKSVIAVTNDQHQLMLDTVEMYHDENKNIDKRKLRERYVAIKENQASILQELKQTFREIGEAKMEEEG